jgi:cellulose synthase/poly-beta-1,6-N-acetylglucosamine synthase-like glycosyltransferase
MDNKSGMNLFYDQLQPQEKLVPAPLRGEAPVVQIGIEMGPGQGNRKNGGGNLQFFPERYARMLVIIPAHDEEQTITDTLRELVRQSRRPEKIVVVADNCTDDTEAVVREFMKTHPEVELMSTRNNTQRKVGALNQGWLLYSAGFDLVASIDADTVLWQDVLADLEKELVPRTRCAGIMAKFTFDQEWVPPQLRRSKEPARGSEEDPINTRLPWAARQLVRAQRLEFTAQTLDFLRHGRQSYVLGGQATLFRQDALLKAAYYNNGYGPWNADTDVEDMELTWRFQELKLETLVSRSARAYAGAMYNTKSLWAQRRKWDEGMIRLLLQYKLHKNTYFPWMRQIKMALDLVVRLMFLLMLTVSISLHSFVWSWVWLIPSILSVLLNVKLFFKMPKRTVGDFIFTVLYFPGEIYLWFRLAGFVASWGSALMGTKKDNWAGQKAAEAGASGAGSAGVMLLGGLLVLVIGMIISLSVMPRHAADQTVAVGWVLMRTLTIILSAQMALKLLYMVLRDRRLQA